MIDPIEWFEQAMHGEMPALARFARKLARDRVAADDLLQDTLLRAWAARSSFDRGTNMRAWLFRIARNSFLNTVRRDRRQVVWDPRVHDAMMVAKPVQEEALLLAELEYALGRLPPEQAEAFRLVTHDGLSYDRAAAQLGVQRGTLGSRVSRARSALLAHCWTDPDQDSQSQASVDQRRQGPLVTRYDLWKASGSRMIG